MDWFSGFVVFVILRWLVFFLTLPFGVKTPHEVGEAVAPGHAPSAPVRHGLALKAGLTTAIAAVLWVGAYFLITSERSPFGPSERPA